MGARRRGRGAARRRWATRGVRRSRRELQAPGLGVHGVALAAAELHAAPRAVVFGFEAAHGAEFSRRGGGGGSRRRGEVGWNLGGDAIEHRLVEKRGEGSRAALRLHSPASRSLTPFAALLFLQHVADACGGCGEGEWREVRGEETRDARGRGCIRHLGMRRGGRSVSRGRTLAVFDLVLAVVVTPTLRLRVIVLERVQSRRGHLRGTGRSGRVG